MTITKNICRPIRLLDIAAAVFLAGCATIPSSPPWGPQNVTPGAVLTLQELGRGTKDGKQVVQYRLVGSGFPQGKSYKVWFRNVGASPSAWKLDFYVDNSGELIGNDGPALAAITLNAAHFAKGEPLEAMVISTDQTVKAFAKAIPFPIEAKEGRCRLWLELASRKGGLFMVFAEGFEPEEEVATVSRSNGEVLQQKIKASGDGKLPPIGLLPAAVSRQYAANYTVISKSCNLTVLYEWGPPALKTQ